MNIASWVKLFDGNGAKSESADVTHHDKTTTTTTSSRRSKRKRTTLERKTLSKEEMEMAFSESKSKKKKQKRQVLNMPWFPDVGKGKKRRKGVAWLKDARSLREEIEALRRYVTPTRSETRVHRTVLRAIQCLARTFMIGETKVEMYGSNAAGVGTFFSDVDLSVKPLSSSSGETKTILRRLADLLRATKWTHRVDVRLKATIPILHIWLASDPKHTNTDKTGCLEVDVSLLKSDGISAGSGNNGNCSIESGTDFVRQTCRKFSNIFIPLVLFVKTMLWQLCLDVPYTGGLSSFKLYVMVATHLIEERRKNRSLKRLDVLLISFLNHYGVNARRNLQRNTILKVPFTTTKSVVRFQNVRRLSRIIAAFKVAHQRLVTHQNIEHVLHIDQLTCRREVAKRSGAYATAELESFLSIYDDE
eukprot:g7117.t1